MFALAAVAVALAVPSQDAAPETIGSWLYSETIDAITDEGRAGAGVFNDDGAFMIKCDAPGPGSVYISFRPTQFLGRSIERRDLRAVTYRFDSNEPVTSGRAWSYTDTSTLLTENVTDFAKRMQSAGRIVMRAETYRFAQVTAVFDLTGADEVVRRVYAACGDTLGGSE